MTEAEWLACDDPLLLLGVQRTGASDRRLSLSARAGLSVRQVGLWTVACCRQDELLIADTRSRAAVEWAERVFDSAIGYAEPGGPSDGDCYLMATAANRCLVVAGCMVDGDDAGAVLCAREAVEILVDDGPERGPLFCDLLRDIFGNPFRPVIANPAWLTSTVLALSRQMYESRDFSPMPILADALQDAGCDNEDVLKHCRGPGPHARGCWVVDAVINKE